MRTGRSVEESRDILVSVIVPVYNVESMLRRCVDSILAQTYRNLEIILVDDGSPDRSGVICDEYAARDARIHVIHQMNHGLPAARNTGLDYASGIYVSFVDSDDAIELGMYERLMDAAIGEDADIVHCGIWFVRDGIRYRRFDRPQFARADGMAALESFLRGKLCESVSGKIFRMSVLKNLRFDTSCYHFGEDTLYTYHALKAARTVAAIPECLYFYIRRSNSLTNIRQRTGEEIATAARVIETISADARVLGNSFDRAAMRFCAAIAFDSFIQPLRNDTARDAKRRIASYMNAFYGRGVWGRYALLLAGKVRSQAVRRSRHLAARIAGKV